MTRGSPVPPPGFLFRNTDALNEHNAKRRECRARAEWFGEEARSEFRGGWPWVALGPILFVWPLAYVVVWLVRWIRRGLQSVA